MINIRRGTVRKELMAVTAILFLFSPVINYYFAFYVGISANATPILLAAFIIASLFGSIALDDRKLLTYGIGMLFVAYAGFSVMYSPASVYPQQKLLFLSAHFVFFLFFTAYADFDFTEAAGRYLYIAAGLSFLLFVINSDIILGSVDRERDLSEGLNASIYLATGFFIGFATLHFLIFSELSFKVKGMVLIAAVSAILYTGSRGPIIFLLFCVALLFLNFLLGRSRLTTSRRHIIPSMVVFLLTPVLLYYVALHTNFFQANEFSRAYTRLSTLSDLSTTGRLKHIEFVWSADYSLSQIFLGRGLGSYGYYFYGVDAREYPHNIILELWYELGVIGVLFFLIFSAVVFSRVRLHNSHLVILAAYPFLELMKSSTFSDFRPFWFCYALVFLISTERKRQPRLNGNVSTG